MNKYTRILDIEGLSTKMPTLSIKCTRYILEEYEKLKKAGFALEEIGSILLQKEQEQTQKLIREKVK